MTMVATAVRTVLLDKEVEATFVPALLPKRSEHQVVFDLVYDGTLDEDEANCKHSETSLGRFGDLNCDACHLPLQWSPGWVKGGLYGTPQETFSWIQNVTKHHLDTVEGTLLPQDIWCNYDLLSDEVLDSFYAIRGL